MLFITWYNLSEFNRHDACNCILSWIESTVLICFIGHKTYTETRFIDRDL